MRIAMLSADNSKKLNVGGKHVHQNLLERALKSLGYEVTVFYPPFESRRWLRILKTLFSNPLTIFPVYRYKYVTNKFITFFSLLELNKFDIVHCHDVISLYPIRHPKVVLTLHGYLAREMINYMRIKVSEKSKQELYNFFIDIEKASLRKANHIITVDTRLKNYIIKEFDCSEDKITVIYNAVDTELFSPVSDKEKISLRVELGLPKDAMIVLVPRRYVKKNGVDYAAQAFRKMKSSNFFFVFAGDGPMKKLIKKILSNNSNVLILGAIPNSLIHKYYKAADVILVPSVTSDDVEEATSLSMLEGMACGKVTICTNVGGMKEVVRNMENAILIQQKDPDAIIEALKYTESNYNSMEQLRINAREYVLKNHSYLEHARRIIKIYESL